MEKQDKNRRAPLSFFEEDPRSFSALSHAWWQQADIALRDQSRPMYKRLTVSFGDCDIAEITEADVKNFLKKLLYSGYIDIVLTSYLDMMTAIFEYAKDKQYIDKNPCIGVGIPKKRSRLTALALTPSERDTVINSSHIWLFPYMALTTGMRKNELLALRFCDVDFDNDCIYVNHTLVEKNGEQFLCPLDDSTGKRTVPLLRILKETLLDLPEREEMRYILSEDGERPLGAARFALLARHYRKKTGIYIMSGQLRHAFVTMAFQCDLQPRTVQNILGHKEIDTVQKIYADFLRKTPDAAEFLIELFPEDTEQRWGCGDAPEDALEGVPEGMPEGVPEGIDFVGNKSF